MNPNEYSYVAPENALSREVGASNPRVLFLPWSGAKTGEGTWVTAQGLAAEGWTATSEPNAGLNNRQVGLVRWILSRSFKFGVSRRLVRAIPGHDLVHIHCGSAHQIVREALPSLVLARFFGKKVVLFFGHADIERLLDRRRKWLLPFLRLSDTIVVGSRYLQKVFGRFDIACTVCLQPLTLEGFEHRSRTKLQPRMLLDCALEPDLNVGCAIRAHRLVKQKYPRAELIVVGSGSERVRLQNAVERDSFCEVDFRGEVSRKELLELYNTCDLLLHTPKVDESPASLVRAFAAGLPIVATDADGLLHMVRDGSSAMVVAAGDHVGVANAILELVENPELTGKLSNQGREESRKYTWSRLRQDWVNLYSTLAYNK